MSTSSNSTTTQVQQQGGSLGGTANAQFKDQDYGDQALGTKQNLRKFFTQLNPLIARVKDLGDGGVSLANLDADFLSLPINAYKSDWTSLVNASVGVVTSGTGVTCYDGGNGWIAYRKDGWGRVDVWIGVNTSGAGGIGTAVLPTEMLPPQGLTLAGNGGTIPSVSVSASGVITFGGAGAVSTFLSYPSATLSPGTVPGLFPVYLKIAAGRTPVAVLFAGAKPQGSPTTYKSNTGLQGAPVGCAWSFLGSSVPAADGTQVNQVRIDSVPGLSPGVNYVLNFLVFYGQTGTSSGA